ncbi:hypothetical protein J1605_018438 [Eschrichtius robustus]|uniref:Homeodomain-only protein n=1 Tax=Eschrichtius robustus TaxID=9764 RepID=A0AB34HTA8_ESCRO|nr:hypothetical protein J1605_018438 [Eschrichtius robustus]
MSAETASGPTEDQVEILEYNFNKVNKHPDPTTLCLIAAEAGLSEEETQVSPRARPTPARGDPPRPPSPGRSREGGGVALALGSLLASFRRLFSSLLPAPREPRPASLPPQHPSFPAPRAPDLRRDEVFPRMALEPTLFVQRNGSSSAWPSGGYQKAYPQSADPSQTEETVVIGGFPP